MAPEGSYRHIAHGCVSCKWSFCKHFRVRNYGTCMWTLGPAKSSNTYRRPFVNHGYVLSSTRSRKFSSPPSLGMDPFRSHLVNLLYLYQAGPPPVVPLPTYNGPSDESTDTILRLLGNITKRLHDAELKNVAFPLIVSFIRRFGYLSH